ncbi:Aminodeoxyfutalosine deaminase [Stieleria maiorica]|uniref:Aminodeoxyfutalosine deaminase n=1 Tax=Stieleria maiorica TaxID=2795974 RepID=A0A5B9MIZ1_9BACT|nr:amidohydrolase family protein [Stieleria maiorica]QEG01222.1 Aminodeoxyfutalosine deaminase [Stieleria maiorica]
MTNDDGDVVKRLGPETIYVAAWIFPISRPPINGGYLRVIGDQIVEIGSVRDPGFRRQDVIDLGEVAVLPRMVNAHTHLEFSDCQSPIGQPGIALAEWIGKVIAARGVATEDQRNARIRDGIAESAGSGVGLIGDIATTPSQYPSDTDTTIVSFAEVLGLSDIRAAERLESAEKHAASLPLNPSVKFAVSPHAAYSTPPELVRRCVELAVQTGATLAMHVAESPDERELLRFGSGRFADALRGAGLWPEGVFPWKGHQPVWDLIDAIARAPRALLIHGNDLQDDEIERIACHPQLSVVYCPRTHDFFGYDAHPVQTLLGAGVRVALGTDSRASNPDLSVWKEVQFLLNQRPDLDPHAVLEMATLAGADALLGAGSRSGRIEAGKTRIPSLVSIPTTAKRLDQVWRDVVAADLSCIAVQRRA